jgi:hypothetical protein
MKLCVVVPSQDYLKQAGVRIRYNRIREHLEELGTELSLEVIDNFGRTTPIDKDVYVLSKCNDARAYVVAHRLSAARKLTGVDFFDDYLSQPADSRLGRMRGWFRDMTGLTDFALCSTERMKEVVTELSPGLPCHVMNDPFEHFDAAAATATLERKLERAHAENRLDIAWFGVGDNSHFRIGLQDLADMGEALAPFATAPFAAQLTILTNPRALQAHTLEMLRRLPLPFTIREWSEDGERELLARSLACFLPVSAQPFSIAKSLNRCITALSSGTQVLAAGFPLYRSFAQFLYNDASKLVHDLEKGTLLLRPETVGALADLLEKMASPVGESTKLAQFLLGRLIDKRSRAVPAARPLAILHGKRTPAWSHKIAQRMGQLSVGTPLSPPELNYDVEFRLLPGSGEIVAVMTEKAWPLLREDCQASLQPAEVRSGRPAKMLTLPGDPALHGVAKTLLSTKDSRLRTLASYGAVMQGMLARTRHLFPGVAAYISEFDDALIAAADEARS